MSTLVFLHSLIFLCQILKFSMFIREHLDFGLVHKGASLLCTAVTHIHLFFPLSAQKQTPFLSHFKWFQIDKVNK